MSVTLYTTLGCHLCDQARALLLTVDPGVAIEAVDIAEDDHLITRYGERIPVLARAGEELAWPFGLLDVQRFLHASA
ncbi:glutaredoxin family protein [Alloalcanivorax mobilis]|uniref:glutaredoxin family protein n=1 Tax=Alloalcanivorax mobilis TaxID=2019569 RepID=UPI000C77CEB3|nr:glutaredoxin family protein [Alloalcanivorax mobilis]